MVPPLALGGEAATTGSTGLAVLALVSMIAVYVGLAAVWWFFFRGRGRAGDKEGDGRGRDREDPRA